MADFLKDIQKIEKNTPELAVVEDLRLRLAGLESEKQAQIAGIAELKRKQAEADSRIDDAIRTGGPDAARRVMREAGAITEDLDLAERMRAHLDRVVPKTREELAAAEAAAGQALAEALAPARERERLRVWRLLADAIIEARRVDSAIAEIFHRHGLAQPGFEAGMLPRSIRGDVLRVIRADLAEAGISTEVGR
jgi:hypothetical protein